MKLFSNCCFEPNFLHFPNFYPLCCFIIFEKTCSNLLYFSKLFLYNVFFFHFLCCLNVFFSYFQMFCERCPFVLHCKSFLVFFFCCFFLGVEFSLLTNLFFQFFNTFFPFGWCFQFFNICFFICFVNPSVFVLHFLFFWTCL